MEEASQLAREVARKELRDQKWQEALKKANGDEQTAISFYAG